jgi:cold shock CspA family protein
VRKKGNITSWYDDKGYGFIKPQGEDGRIFVHIKAFANRTQRPIVGDVIRYSISSDSRGRPRADKATISGYFLDNCGLELCAIGMAAHPIWDELRALVLRLISNAFTGDLKYILGDIRLR